MITNYAIIDHVGQVANISAVYAKAYSYAVGYDKVYTLKKACQMRNPNYDKMTEEKQKSMKYAMRLDNEKGLHPKKVYIVCSYPDAKAEFVADMWRNKNIDIEYITEEPDPDYGYGLDWDSASIYRKCAYFWANALGWQFSAPLFKDAQPEQIDMYTARPKRNTEKLSDEAPRASLPLKELEDEDLELLEFLMFEPLPENNTDELLNNEYVEEGSYGAKRFTRPESYLNSFRRVASEDECKAFFEHYRWLYENNLLTESLEPDWVLCPKCGRPVRLGTAETIICPTPGCDTEIHSEVFETYYDDSYIDSDE